MCAPNSIRLTISINEIFKPGGLSLYLKSGKRLTSSLKRKLASRTARKTGASSQLADRHSKATNTPQKPTHTTATHISDRVAKTASRLPSAMANKRSSRREWERRGGEGAESPVGKARSLGLSNPSIMMFCLSITFLFHPSTLPHQLSLHRSCPAQHCGDGFE